MEHLEIILSLAGACIGLISAVAALVAKYAKSAKARKIAEQAADICDALLPYIKQAERLNFSGQEKKEYVMTRINRYAIDKGIYFDEEAVSEKIEEYIALSKEVNVRDSATVKNASLPMKKAIRIRIPTDRNSGDLNGK